MMISVVIQLLPMTALASPDPLKPDSVTEPGVVTLSKTADRVGPDEWEVTLSVDAEQTLYNRSLELVLLIDTSGSMARCAKEEHTHTLECKRNGCDKDEHKHSSWANRPCEGAEATDCRQYIAGTALQSFIKGLNESEMASSVAVCTFGNRGYTKLERTNLNDDTVDAVCDAIPTEAPEKTELTNLYRGLLNARDEFSESNDTLKLLLILCDGEYTGVLPVVTAANMRESGIIIDSIGFMYHSTAVSEIATENHYQYANDGIDLQLILDDYLNSLRTMVTDTMGDSVSLSELVSYSKPLEPVTTDSKLTWHPETGNIPAGETVEIVYKTKLDPEALVPGVYDIPLNEEAMLVYSTDADNTIKNLAFPVPYAHYEVGRLTVSYEGLPAELTPAAQSVTMVTDYGDAEFKFVPVTEKTIVAADGSVYVYRGSVYTDANGVEHIIDGAVVDSIDAAAGEHTLVHKYTVNKEHCVSYIYAGAVPPTAEPLPATQVYAEGTVGIAVADEPAAVPGYTFTGWKTINVAVNADNTFTMPATNVVFVGTWVVNPKPVVFPVSYVYDLTAPAGAPLPPATKFYKWGDKVEVEDKPVYDGYEFIGWIPTTVFVWTGEGEFAMPNWHVVFVGSWRRICEEPTVSYKYIGDVPVGAPALPETKSYKPGTLGIEVEDEPYVPGYVFLGWYTNDTIVIADHFMMPCKDVVFVGSWKKICCPCPGTTPETDPTTPPETDPETTPDTDPVTPPETDPETTPDTDPVTPPETDPETTPDTDPVTPPETDPVTTPDTDPVTPPETDPETTPDTDPVTPPETDPETTPDTDPVTPPETDPETTPDTDPVTPPETDPETTPDTDPVTPPETDPETTPDTDPVTPPETDPETTPETEPETTPDTEPEENPTTNPKTSNVWMAGILMALCASAMVFVFANKKRVR